jgi:hypothetical protein
MNNLTLTIDTAPKQTFNGFGISEMNDQLNFQKLTPAVQSAISVAAWKDLSLKSFRLWWNPTESVASWKAKYIDSNLITLAKANGCTKLLLAPNTVPTAYSSGGLFTDSGVLSYAKDIANFIALLKNTYGISIDYTGVLNEPNDRPIQFKLSQWPTVIKALRSNLNSLGLTSVKIVAPESASADDTGDAMIAAIKSDATAWAALDAIATHTYNMGARDQTASYIAGTNKQYWITESGINGPEALGDIYNAATSAAMAISDLNHGVTDRLWFIGYEQTDPNDNATRLIQYDFSTGKWDKLYKYYWMQQLSQAFIPGTVMRQVRASSGDSTMTWTYGKKPPIMACAGVRPDGRIAIAAINYTSNDWANRGSAWDKEQSGPPAATYSLTVNLTNLSASVWSKVCNSTSTGTAAWVPAQRTSSETIVINPLSMVVIVL